MRYHAKNGTVPVGGTDMDYISFGTGRKRLVMLPGVGDGLVTVKGKALPFAAMYRMYAKEYTVYVFSRKNQLSEGYSTRDMARDQAEAMRQLGIFGAHVMGVSQGGMIAQYLAIDFPELVDKLVLVVTLSSQNETVQKTVGGWIGMARHGDYRRIMIDTTEKSYSEAYLRRHRFLYPLLGRVGKPKDFTRFLIQAESCLHHDAYGMLDKIQAPTLVIGGGSDKIVGPEASREIAEKIPGSRLLMYDGLGHGAYEEAGDFHDQVLTFLGEKA